MAGFDSDPPMSPTARSPSPGIKDLIIRGGHNIYPHEME
jgi:acyl-CoA synthetase (AMP-forming)/AMP-acid ligase II